MVIVGVISIVIRRGVDDIRCLVRRCWRGVVPIDLGYDSEVDRVRSWL